MGMAFATMLVMTLQGCNDIPEDSNCRSPNLFNRTGGYDCAVCKTAPECMSCADGYKAVQGESWDLENFKGQKCWFLRTYTCQTIGEGDQTACTWPNGAGGGDCIFCDDLPSCKTGYTSKTIIEKASWLCADSTAGPCGLYTCV